MIRAQASGEQPRRRRQRERHKITGSMSESNVTARAFYILVYFLAVRFPCKTTTTPNDQIIAFVKSVNKRQSIFFFLCELKGRSAHLMKRLPHISLSLSGKTISPVSFAKDLGVYIDQYLTNDVHITKTVSSCMNQLVQIARIKHLLDKKTLLLLNINSFVFSKLFYCSSVWGNTSKRNLHKLQFVQNFAARVVLGLRKFNHISQGRRSLKWLDVTEKVLFNDLILVFKCVNGLAPDHLSKYFIKRSVVHNKNTSECNNFVVPRCRLSTGQRAFYFRGPREWNGLADYIKNTKDINSFKWTLFNNMFHMKKF